MFIPSSNGGIKKTLWQHKSSMMDLSTRKNRNLGWRTRTCLCARDGVRTLEEQMTKVLADYIALSWVFTHSHTHTDTHRHTHTRARTSFLTPPLLDCLGSLQTDFIGMTSVSLPPYFCYKRSRLDL